MKRNRSVLLMSLVSAVAAIGFTLLSTWTIQKRVKGIIKTMTLAETGDFSVRAGISPYNDELDKIGSSLNGMIMRIKEHIDAEYLSELRRRNAELKQRDAELYALQSAVNPHFLYNTLESIRMQAVLNEDKETASLIRLLAGLFRSRIKKGNVVRIKDELDYCRSLTDILSVRYGGAVEIVFDVPGEIGEYAVPRDLLQPALENVFVHGFSGDEADGKKLTISGSMKGGEIILQVANNGQSIGQERLAQIREYLECGGAEGNGGSFGLHNVHQRIRLIYGDGFGVQIASSRETGTIVSIKIQALRADELKKLIS
jgi:two-component system sensor histidine kinase YesM